MTNEFAVEGMTCNGCVATVAKKLESVDGISQAEVSLLPPVAKIHFTKSVSQEELQNVLGKYKITNTTTKVTTKESATLPEKSWTTYKPLAIIVLFITGVSFLSQYPFDNFSWMLWMRFFMAGFFIVFSFFKMINLTGFASSYSMYDIIAKRWFTWGYIYPFAELALGVLYLTNIAPYFTNLTTVIILGVSTIGVIESNVNNRKIKCACLGDVFNLPMSTVTIVEDVIMVAMAGLMLIL